MINISIIIFFHPASLFVYQNTASVFPLCKSPSGSTDQGCAWLFSTQTRVDKKRERRTVWPTSEETRQWRVIYIEWNPSAHPNAPSYWFQNAFKTPAVIMECPHSDLKGSESLDISNDLSKRPSLPHEGSIRYQGRLMSAGEDSVVCKWRSGKSPTLVSKFEARSVLGVVAVEVDDGFVRAAQYRGWHLASAELSNQRAAVVRPVENL